MNMHDKNQNPHPCRFGVVIGCFIAALATPEIIASVEPIAHGVNEYTVNEHGVNESGVIDISGTNPQPLDASLNAFGSTDQKGNGESPPTSTSTWMGFTPPLEKPDAFTPINTLWSRQDFTIASPNFNDPPPIMEVTFNPPLVDFHDTQHLSSTPTFTRTGTGAIPSPATIALLGLSGLLLKRSRKRNP